MKDLIGDNSSLVLIVISTLGYVLFVDVVRAYLNDLGLGTGDRVVLIGIVLVILLIGVKFEGGGQ